MHSLMRFQMQLALIALNLSGDRSRRLGNRETAAALAYVPGSDIADVRRQLIVRQAPMLYIRSFGTLELHRGSWTGLQLTIDRKRTRTLLGLLVAYAGPTLTRDMVLGHHVA